MFAAEGPREGGGSSSQSVRLIAFRVGDLRESASWPPKYVGADRKRQDPVLCSPLQSACERCGWGRQQGKDSFRLVFSSLYVPRDGGISATPVLPRFARRGEIAQGGQMFVV